MSDRLDLSHYIPRRLDDPGKFLFWDRDVALIALLGMFVGIAFEWPVTGVACGVFAAYCYNKLKSGKHPGMAKHLLYWFFGLPQPSGLPESHFRELNG